MLTIEKLIEIANTTTCSSVPNHHESTMRVARIYELTRTLLLRGVPSDVVLELTDSLMQFRDATGDKAHA